MARFLLLPALLWGLLAPQSLAARPFDARVVRVIDGDSLVVERIPQKRTSELRLQGIDAPEHGQPWGAQAKSALRRMVDGKTVQVEVITRDSYGRLVVRMWVGRTYVNAAMTASGNAWAYRRYDPDAEILAGEAQAKATRRGLWSLPPEQRIPPATWRQRAGSGR